MLRIKHDRCSLQRQPDRLESTTQKSMRVLEEVVQRIGQGEPRSSSPRYACFSPSHGLSDAYDDQYPYYHSLHDLMSPYQPSIAPPVQPDVPVTPYQSQSHVQQTTAPALQSTTLAQSHIQQTTTPVHGSIQQRTTPASHVQPTTTPAQSHLDSLVIARVRSASCSRENFAANLIRELFTMEERLSSNIAGKCGKSKLGPKRVDSIREATFQMFPPGPSENLKRSWATCIRAIDSANRSLVRKMGKENMPK